MNGVDLKALYESDGAVGFTEKMTGLLKSGKVDARDFDLQEMAIAMLGERRYMLLGERYSRRRDDPSCQQALFMHDESASDQYKRLDEGSHWSADPNNVLREAGDAVDVASFAALTGQIAYTAFGRGWNNAEMIGDRLYKNFPTEFSGQKIPWLSNLFGSQPGDGDIHPGTDYPETTFGPRYVQNPRVLKKGAILSISLEFLLFNRVVGGTDWMEKIAKGVRYQKEYMQLRVMMGYNPGGPLTANIGNANWNGTNWGYNLNGVFISVYNTSNVNFVNAQGSNPLTDYSALNNALQLRSQILDPDTGRPIQLGAPKTLFVMPGQIWNAKRILTATSVRTIYPSYATAPTAGTQYAQLGNVQFDSSNPIDWNLEILTSPIAQQIASQATVSPAGVAGTGGAGVNAESQYSDWWFLFNQASDPPLWYAEVFPFRTEQAISGNIREFQADIKLRYRMQEMGSAFWYDPRQAMFFYNA